MLLLTWLQLTALQLQPIILLFGHSPFALPTSPTRSRRTEKLFRLHFKDAVTSATCAKLEPSSPPFRDS